MQTMPRGSAHEIEIAQRFHKNRGRVPRFLYSQREKVSAWELSDVRVLRSQNTDCRKNDSFSTVSNRGQAPRFFLWQRKSSETDRKTRLRDTSQNRLHGEGKLHPSLRYGQMSLCRKHKNERIDFLIIGRLSEIVENSKKNVPVSRESSIINTIIRRDG